MLQTRLLLCNRVVYYTIMEQKNKGRKPIFDTPMTGAERVARHRMKHNKVDTYTVVIMKEVERQDRKIRELEKKVNTLLERFA